MVRPENKSVNRAGLLLQIPRTRNICAARHAIGDVMKFAKTVLAAAAMALACGAAFAADSDKDNKHHKGFNDMDKNADGKLTRTEDLTLMAKVDAHKVKEKVSGAPEAVKKETAEAKRRAPDASTGSTATADNPKPQ